MATTNYNLPTISDNMTADVVRDHNALAGAVDTAIKTVDTRITQHINDDSDWSDNDYYPFKDAVTQHLDDNVKHVTTAERNKWNTVGTVANLQTTNKTDLVGAVNELFTSVSDGKNAIASAITSKGQTASGSDTFAQLSTKITNISTGKKFASGNTTASFNTTGSYVFTVTTSLNFTPGSIFCYFNGTIDAAGLASAQYAVVGYGSSFVANAVRYRPSGAGDFLQVSIINVSSSSFTVQVYRSDGSVISANNQTVRWMAFE